MTRLFSDFLFDMLSYAGKANEFVGSMSAEDLAADERTFLATVRAIEIVGEAARHVPEAFRVQFPDIPWRQIIAMRNILVHNYEGSDPKIVHRTATVNMPRLIDALPAAIEAARRQEPEE